MDTPASSKFKSHIFHSKMRCGIASAAFISILLILGGCLKNEFNISISLPSSVAETYRIEYYASSANQEMMVETAVAVSAGKGVLHCVTKNPALVSLFGPHDALPGCLIFAKRGDDISITGEEGNPLNWTVAGNKINESLTQWRLENKDLLKDIVRTGGSGSKSASENINAAISKFVDKNPDNPASLFIFMTYFSPADNPGEFKRLREVLKKSGLMEKYGYLITRQDFLTATSLPVYDGRTPDKASNVIIKSYLKGIDTIKFEGSNPLLVYFWRRGDLRRNEDIDSLKRLARWRKDSSAMTIADICMESDSASWVYPIRNDSLHHTLRGWMPRGFSDPDVMRLGVGTTPWWIVATGKGKVIYSGRDAEIALTKFRSMKNK